LKQITQFLQYIRYSLWFRPTMIMTAAILLAFLSIELDTQLDPAVLSEWSMLFGANADGARSMLETVAGAMISVAALTFSITVLVLSLGATQYTPRVIRTFMGNRATQTVLGVFVGIFVYCLIVLRVVQGGSGDAAMVPSISVTVAILLALVGVGFLVFFIHHIASSIQASDIISSVSSDTIETIDKIYPERLVPRNPGEAIWRLGRDQKHEWFGVCSTRTGYLQSVDLDGLVDFAKQYRVVVKMEKSAGDFVVRGLTIASITGIPNSAITRKLNSLYSIGHYRTVDQDPGMGVRQLVDIALKAMSPSINDTTTAVMCIDFLSAIMIRLAPRRLVPEPQFNNSELVLIPKGPDFCDFLRESFEQIREHANGNVSIYVRLLEALEILARLTSDASRKKDIAEHVRLVSDYARCNVHFPDQLKRIEKHRTQALRCCVLEAAAS
jgi:uncharacterized membrane protein